MFAKVAMKVILVPSSVDLVGVSVHVYNLAKLLSESGLLDVVLCPRDGWLPQKLADSRIPHVVIHLSHRSSNIVRASLSLWQFFRSRKAAYVVHGFHKAGIRGHNAPVWRVQFERATKLEADARNFPTSAHETNLLRIAR